MSESAPSSDKNPPLPKISDRAALEAAIAGAAGLLLGRLLLGRGAGLLAGGTAVAARLLTAAARPTSTPPAAPADGGSSDVAASGPEVPLCPPAEAPETAPDGSSVGEAPDDEGSLDATLIVEPPGITSPEVLSVESSPLAAEATSPISPGELLSASLAALAAKSSMAATAAPSAFLTAPDLPSAPLEPEAFKTLRFPTPTAWAAAPPPALPPEENDVFDPNPGPGPNPLWAVDLPSGPEVPWFSDPMEIPQHFSSEASPEPLEVPAFPGTAAPATGTVEPDPTPDGTPEAALTGELDRSNGAFANLFQPFQAPPDTSPADPPAAPLAEVPPDDSPLPAFPNPPASSFAESSPFNSPGPAIVALAPVPNLPPFPFLSATGPHPEDIWKAAAKEATTPIAGVAEPPASGVKPSTALPVQIDSPPPTLTPFTPADSLPDFPAPDSTPGTPGPSLPAAGPEPAGADHSEHAPPTFPARPRTEPIPATSGPFPAPEASPLPVAGTLPASMLPVPVSPFASLHPSGATAAPAEATAGIRPPFEAFAAPSAPDTLPAATPTPDSTGTPFPSPAPLPPAPATSSVPLTFGNAGSATAPATAHSGKAPAYAIPPGASQPARQKAPPLGKRTPFGLIIFLTLVLGLVLFYRHEQSKKAAAATAPASLPAPAPPAPPPPLPASSTTAPAASTPLPKPAAPMPSPTVIPATPPAAPATPPTPTPAAAGSPKIAGAPPATPATEPVIHGEAIPGVSQDFAPGSPEEQSYQTLEKLLTARKPDEIKAYVHQPAEALRKASSYFPGGDLNPAPWHRIFYDSSTQIPKSAYKARLFRVITDAVPLGFPVAVEETANGPRIDYDAFIQCRNRMLDTFLTTPSAPPAASSPS